MKSIQNQYRDLKEGRMSQANFMRNLRMTMPHYVTNVTSFNDAVKILKNKAILTEAALGENNLLDELESEMENGNSYAEAISTVAAKHNMNEDDLATKYPEEAVGNKAYADNYNDMVDEADDEDDEIEAMISQAEEEESGKYTKFQDVPGAISEALNKDIKLFGQDLDKRFKEAGFDTLVTMQQATPEQLKIVASNPKAALFEVSQTPETQMLVLRVNPKMEAKAKSIVDKFQLSNYSGPVLKRGWTAKQVQGAMNPGDIVKQEEGRGVFYFYRFAKVDTKVKNVTEGKGKDLHPNQINPDELRMGIKVELEHTDDLDKAKKIALDHLAENPYYYTALKLPGIESPTKPKEKPVKEKKTKKRKEAVQLVDLANQMQKVKMPKADEKKKLKEANYNIDGEPNAAAEQAMKFVDGNATLKALSDDIEIQQSQDDAILRYSYWKALPSEAIEKLKLQFDVEVMSDFDEDTGEIIAYRLTPLRKNYSSKDLGASFEKFKSQLEEVVRETLAEMQSDEQETDTIAMAVDETFDGRDNLDAKNTD